MTTSLRLACVGGLGLFGGCVDDVGDREPPVVTGIRLVEEDTIRMTFSEVILAPKGLEIGVFRLSAAIVKDGRTSYYALAATDEDLGGSEGSGSSDGGSTDDGASSSAGVVAAFGPKGELIGGGGPVAVLDAVIREVEKPIDLYANAIEDELDIELFDPIGDTEGCARLRGIPLADGAVFLHYLPGSAAAITDIEGNGLAGLAPHWVAHDELATDEVDGRFPEMRPPMPMPCP